ncbi:MAG: patatin family protein [Clostridia bacterium]|nr:patatin family protein [Clostridia bacterium]
MLIGVIDVGGGTRGVYGAGVFDWCMDHGVSFDYFAGVSAGSANGASFLAGQRGRNLRFYNEYAFRKEYMSWNNFRRTGEYIDLDYIYTTLSGTNGEDPLDYDAMMRNPTRMEIVASNAILGVPEYYSKEIMRRDDYAPIKGSCAVPLACKPYNVYGTPCFDGGISDPIPYARAFAQGCDHVVVVLTRPKSSFRKPNRDIRFARLLRRRYPKAAELLSRRSETYNRSLRAVLELERQGKVTIIAPEDIGQMKTLTQDHAAILSMYEKGYRDASVIERL